MPKREPKAIAERIGRMVRERRLDLKISARDLSRRMDLTHAYVKKIEDGIHALTAGTLLRLCRVLGLSADALLGVKEDA